MALVIILNLLAHYGFNMQENKRIFYSRSVLSFFHLINALRGPARVPVALLERVYLPKLQTRTWQKLLQTVKWIWNNNWRKVLKRTLRRTESPSSLPSRFLASSTQWRTLPPALLLLQKLILTIKILLKYIKNNFWKIRMTCKFALPERQECGEGAFLYFSDASDISSEQSSLGSVSHAWTDQQRPARSHLCASNRIFTHSLVGV